LRHEIDGVLARRVGVIGHHQLVAGLELEGAEDGVHPRSGVRYRADVVDR
jgi:hypothetical protein